MTVPPFVHSVCTKSLRVQTEWNLQMGDLSMISLAILPVFAHQYSISYSPRYSLYHSEAYRPIPLFLHLLQATTLYSCRRARMLPSNRIHFFFPQERDIHPDSRWITVPFHIAHTVLHTPALCHDRQTGPPRKNH